MECAAPIASPRGEPVLCCEYCGASLTIGGRGGAIAVGTGAVSEAERIATLQTGWRRRRLRPGSVAHFVSEEKLDVSKADEAWQRWHAVRRACLGSESTPYKTQEELFHLSLLLEPSLRRTSETVRAVLESALDCLDEPAFRQELCGHLVRDAVRVRDVSSARDWLEQMDPRPTDLHADSAYRLAKAFILAVEDDAQELLDVVGRDSVQVAIAVEEEAPACLFRVHAYERLGDAELARKQLHVFMSQSSPLGGTRAYDVHAFVADAQLPIALAPRVYEVVTSQLRLLEERSGAGTLEPGGAKEPPRPPLNMAPLPTYSSPANRQHLLPDVRRAASHAEEQARRSFQVAFVIVGLSLLAVVVAMLVTRL
jgi:hypothetical protein